MKTGKYLSEKCFGVSKPGTEQGCTKHKDWEEFKPFKYKHKKLPLAGTILNQNCRPHNFSDLITQVELAHSDLNEANSLSQTSNFWIPFSLDMIIQLKYLQTTQKNTRLLRNSN